MENDKIPVSLIFNLYDHDAPGLNPSWSSIIFKRNNEEVKFSNEEIFNLLKKLKKEFI